MSTSPRGPSLVLDNETRRETDISVRPDFVDGDQQAKSTNENNHARSPADAGFASGRRENTEYRAASVGLAGRS